MSLNKHSNKPSTSYIISSNGKNKKLVLSRWRHKFTGSEYIDSLSQTGPSMKYPRKDEVFSRETQTIATKEMITDIARNRSTQMSKKGCYISSETDRYKSVGEYETCEEMLKRLDFDGNARKIQKNYRIYKLMCCIKKCARLYRETVAEEKRKEEEKILAEKKLQEETLYRMANPKTTKDFSLLYAEIDKWREERFESVKRGDSELDKCRENYLILEETLSKFLNIEKLKQVARNAYKEKSTAKFLEIYCQPLRWIGYKGLLIEVVNLKTQKARDIMATFGTLNNQDASIDERMEILTTLKRSLEPHNCLAAFKLIDLINQEITVLSRGIDCLELDCLRKRIARGFLRFISISAVCASTDRDKLPLCQCDNGEWQGPLEARTMLCRSCQKILPYRRFTNYDKRKALTNYCNDCSNLRRRDDQCMNYDKYQHILLCMRSEEKSRNCFSGLAHMLHASDIYHLVNVIWHGCSVLSKQQNVDNLRLIRYRLNEDWTPWNCILLTREEATAHLAKEIIAYPKHIVRQIILRHQIAKNHYKYLNINVIYKPEQIDLASGSETICTD